MNNDSLYLKLMQRVELFVALKLGCLVVTHTLSGVINFIVKQLLKQEQSCN